MCALTMGAIFGVIACGATLAPGFGHGAHSPTAASDSETAPSAVAVTDADRHQPHDAVVEPMTIAVTLDVSADIEREGSTSQNVNATHLEMGCVVPIDLRPIELAIDHANVGIDIPQPSPRPDCILAPEPPVPRSS